jgi:hypothetical protein
MMRQETEVQELQELQNGHLCPVPASDFLKLVSIQASKPKGLTSCNYWTPATPELLNS